MKTNFDELRKWRHYQVASAIVLLVLTVTDVISSVFSGFNRFSGRSICIVAFITSIMALKAVASSDPNVDYILKGRSERIATYMKCSLSNEYCMCVEQVVRKGGEVFRCSVFLHTNNAYIVWQDASFSEAPQFAECAREVSALQGGANIKCEVKAIGPELAQKVRQLHALWGESRYERMAWGSGIGHVVIILQDQGKESIALYDRPVWEEKQDMRKVFYCRDVYGEESACRYSCFLRVYRLLQNLLITECKQTK